MSAFYWYCPRCRIRLCCDSSQGQGYLNCPECSAESCPQDFSLQSALASLDVSGQQALNNHVQGFRQCLADSFDEELQDAVSQLDACATTAETVGELSFYAFVLNHIVLELGARPAETPWAKTKRHARRGAQAAKGWLKTEQGQTIAAGLATLAALWGIDSLSD